MEKGKKYNHKIIDLNYTLSRHIGPRRTSVAAQPVVG